LFIFTARSMLREANERDAKKLTSAGR